MATDVDIANRALQMMASRNVITSLTDGSNEAANANMLYTPTLDWCLGITNWNFARKTAVLVLSKTRNVTPITWSATEPAPPWRYEYEYPADCIRLHYVTNMVVANTKWTGMPQKFAVTTGIISAAPRTVILTDETNALGVYTYRNVTIDNWSSLFNQAFTSTLAWMLAGPVSGDKDLMNSLREIASDHMTLAIAANTREGTVMDDTTPEWIQARGIPYPQRRPTVPVRTQTVVEPQNDRRR